MIKYTSEIFDVYRNAAPVLPPDKVNVFSDSKLMYALTVTGSGEAYLTTETPGEKTSFIKTDIKNQLTSQCGLANFRVKMFEAAYNAETQTYVYLVVITRADGKDYLFGGQGSSMFNLDWSEKKFDDTSVSLKSIEHIYLLVHGEQIDIVCDIRFDDGNTHLHRYFIDWDKFIYPKCWNRHDFGINLEVTVSSCFGRLKSDYLKNVPVNGIYTLGKIAGCCEISYMPLYNWYRLELDPDITRLYAPVGVDVLTAFWDKDDAGTHLAAFGNGMMCLFTSDQQKDSYRAEPFIKNALFTDLKQIHSHVINKVVYIFCLNGQGKVFYMYCNLEDVADASKWSDTFVLQRAVSRFFALPNTATKCNEYVCVKPGENMVVRMQQHPKDHTWNGANMLLPPKDAQKEAIVKGMAYSTKVMVSDAKGAVSNKKVTITAETGCSAYINNLYTSLPTGKAVTVSTDGSGALHIVQEANSLNPSKLTIKENVSNVVSVTPFEDHMDKLLCLNTADSLRNAKLPNGSPLLSPNLTDYEINTAAQTIDLLKQQKASLSNAANMAKNTPAPESGRKELLSFYVHKGRICKEKVLLNHPSYIAMQGKSFWGDIASAFGDVIHFFEDAGEAIYRVAIQVIDGVWSFVVQIGDAIYHFALDTFKAIVGALECVFNMIKTIILNCIEFVKCLFNWPDILKTKHLMVNLYRQSISCIKQDLLTLKAGVDTSIESLIKSIDDWAGVPYDGNLHSPDSYSGKAGDLNHASGSFIVEPFKYNISHASISDNLSQLFSITEEMQNTSAQSAWDILKQALNTEEKVAEKFASDIKSLVVNDLRNMNVVDILKHLAAYISTAVLRSVENFADATIDFVIFVADLVDQFMQAKIHIPVVSDLLNDILGIPKFSLLDIICLVPSVVATPIILAVNKDIYKNIDPSLITPSMGSMKALHTTESKRCVFGIVRIVAGVSKIIQIPLDLLADQFKKEGGTSTNYPDIASTAIKYINKGIKYTAKYLHLSYNPPSVPGNEIIDTTITALDTVSGIISGSRFVGKKILGIKDEPGGFGSTLDAIADVCDTGSSILTLGSNVVDLFRMAGMSWDSDEKAFAYIEKTSSIISCTTTVMGVVVKYDSDPTSKEAIIATKALLNFCSGELLVAEGTLALNSSIA